LKTSREKDTYLFALLVEGVELEELLLLLVIVV
jgi:hypothetical protein